MGDAQTNEKVVLVTAPNTMLDFIEIGIASRIGGDQVPATIRPWGTDQIGGLLDDIANIRTRISQDHVAENNVVIRAIGERRFRSNIG